MSGDSEIRLETGFHYLMTGHHSYMVVMSYFFILFIALFGGTVKLWGLDCPQTGDSPASACRVLRLSVSPCLAFYGLVTFGLFACKEQYAELHPCSSF